MADTAAEYARLPHCPGSHEPSPRQLYILRAVVSHTREHGQPPGLRDLMRVTGIVSTNGVREHLISMEGKGLIARGGSKRREGSIARAIHVTEAGKQALGMEPGACIHCGGGGG